MNPENCPIELPVVGSPSVRSDAARNRMLILAAAERLFAKNGVTCTSMDAIAAEAGVGKGTLFRRFGDRGSLVFALLDSTAREFQDRFISGPPPLGPGAPPVERLTAFGEALLAPPPSTATSYSAPPAPARRSPASTPDHTLPTAPTSRCSSARPLPSSTPSTPPTRSSRHCAQRPSSTS